MMKYILSTVFVLIVVGCGISTNNNSAFKIDPERAGIDVFETPSTTISGPVLNNEKTGRLYLIDKASNLVVVNRQFSKPPSPQDILDALTLSPTAAEISSTEVSSTELPPNLEPKLAETNTTSSEILIMVSDEANLRETAQSESRRTNRIFAQIVCTLDWFQISPGNSSNQIAGVIIEDSQGQIVATDNETAPINRPAKPSDFGNCSTGSAQTAPERE